MGRKVNSNKELDLKIIEYRMFNNDTFIEKFLKPWIDMRGVEREVFVSPEDSAMARSKIIDIIYGIRKCQAYVMSIRKFFEDGTYRCYSVDKKPMVVEHMYRKFLVERGKLWSEIDDALRFLAQMCCKYPWLLYASLTATYTVKLPLLTYLADPPEGCILGSISGPTNWAVGLNPFDLKKNGEIVKRHASLPSKLHYTLLSSHVFPSTGRSRIVSMKRIFEMITSKCVSSQKVNALVERLYVNNLEKAKKSIEEKVKRGEVKVRKREGIESLARVVATLRTFRELIQITALNTYLIFIAYMHEQELDKKLNITPKPPYELRENPERATTYLDPIDLIHYKNIDIATRYLDVLRWVKWTWFVETYLLKK